MARSKGYRFALEWIVLNDDWQFLHDDAPIPSVSTCFVADLFDVDQDKVVADLIKTGKHLLPASFADIGRRGSAAS